MTNKSQKELLDSYAKNSLLDNNSKFVELSTQFTVEVLKERLAFFEQSTDVSIVGDLCKYVINDFMEHMLDNGKDREQTRATRGTRSGERQAAGSKAQTYL